MKKEKLRKVITVGLKVSKVFAVVALFYCSYVLYLFVEGAKALAGVILLIVCLFIIFNQLDALNKR